MSPVDKAVMISVADWFPVFPPVEIISGIKSTSHVWRLRTSVLYRSSAMAVNRAPNNKAVTQTDRFQVSVSSPVSR